MTGVGQRRNDRSPLSALRRLFFHTQVYLIWLKLVSVAVKKPGLCDWLDIPWDGFAPAVLGVLVPELLSRVITVVRIYLVPNLLLDRKIYGGYRLPTPYDTGCDGSHFYGDGMGAP